MPSRHSHCRLVLVALSLAGLSRLASAQATILVDPTDPVYRDIATLVGNGLVDTVVIGQRPYSRAAIARMIAEASARLQSPVRLAAQESDRADSRTDDREARARTPSSFLQALVRSLQNRFASELGAIASDSAREHFFEVAPLRDLTTDATQATSETRTVPRTNGLGEVDATVNPLLSYREGRALGEGSNILLETSHALQSRRFAVLVTPQLLMRRRTADSGMAVDGGLQNLQLRFLMKNLVLDVGREYVVWGQGRDIGLLNSTNSPPLDVIKISNEQVFRIPLLRRLGPAKLSVYYADLGRGQNFPHAYTVAYKASFVTSPMLEWGAGIYTKAGGKGAPQAKLSARLLDLLPFTDASNYNYVIGTRGDFQFSDHYAGLDGRLRLPAARSELFWELLLNDFDVRRLASVLWDDAGHVFGLTVPRLSSDGRLAASLEYHHTGLRYYEHHQFVTGQALRRTLVGDPLGANSWGVYAELSRYVTVEHRFSIQAALEQRNNSQYELRPEPNFGFRLVTPLPKEWRYRAVATWRNIAGAGAAGIISQLGYERVTNFNFERNSPRNGWLARIGVEYRFE
jgi:hypothetical protein